MAKKKSSAKKIDSDPIKAINEIAKTWKEWKDLKSWEKNSKISQDIWKEKIMTSATNIIKKALKKNPERFAKYDEEKFCAFLHEVKRRIYGGEYATKTKTFGGARSTSEYLVWICPYELTLFQSLCINP